MPRVRMETGKSIGGTTSSGGARLTSSRKFCKKRGCRPQGPGRSSEAPGGGIKIDQFPWGKDRGKKRVRSKRGWGPCKRDRAAVERSSIPGLRQAQGLEGTPAGGKTTQTWPKKGNPPDEKRETSGVMNKRHKRVDTLV